MVVVFHFIVDRIISLVGTPGLALVLSWVIGAGPLFFFSFFFFDTESGPVT